MDFAKAIKYAYRARHLINYAPDDQRQSLTAALSKADSLLAHPMTQIAFDGKVSRVEDLLDLLQDKQTREELLPVLREPLLFFASHPQRREQLVAVLLEALSRHPDMTVTALQVVCDFLGVDCDGIDLAIVVDNLLDKVVSLLQREDHLLQCPHCKQITLL